MIWLLILLALAVGALQPVRLDDARGPTPSTRSDPSRSGLPHYGQLANGEPRRRADNRLRRYDRVRTLSAEDRREIARSAQARRRGR